ncbi:MAG: efflux RND transporter periplasmic adaptor subunit [Candidatus Omnitrophica bacterium]|nr:efflux RND transporter periplasmic adaptor subunit [Candidatus Omnitrophota bacterium]
MKKKKKFILIALILAIASYAAVVFILKERQANNKVIKVSGNIEGDDVRISFRVAGQIIELLTDEGKVIKTGDIVARLNKDELSKVQAEAEAALKLAEYQYKLDYDDYIRAENLLKAGAISAQQRDAAKTKMDTDSASIKQLRASLELANTKLGWADLASPLDGYVLVKSALPGEVVQPGSPVFTAVNLDDLWVTAYINETDLGKVKLGQKAYVETDTYRGKKYNGRVSFISSQTEFTPKYIQTNEERVKYVYRIKVKVDNASLDLKPGMPADAYIITE